MVIIIIITSTSTSTSTIIIAQSCFYTIYALPSIPCEIIDETRLLCNVQKEAHYQVACLIVNSNNITVESYH